jgi:hypothetical protein
VIGAVEVLLPIAAVDDLQRVLRDWPPGKPARLALLRRGGRLEVTAFPR